MRDELGSYYHAQAGNPSVRVYVREGEDGEVEFRMWERDHPEVWEEHPWLPYAVIRDAAELYRAERNPAADPLRLYDLNIAKTLLREEKS